MFARLLVAIVVLGMLACALLALRHQRLQAASELAQAQLRIRGADDRLLDLRAAVAARITPQQVEVLASGVGSLRPATNDAPLDVLAQLSPPDQVKGKQPSRGARVAQSGR
jgi:hypothetical protein